MRLAGRSRALVLCSLIFAGSTYASGQTLPWPLDNQNGPHRITGTLGEYRTGPPLHFHDGVDVSTSSTFPSITVKAILDGTIINSNNGVGANNNFVTIQSGQYIFIYMHVVPSFSTTSIIAGDVIGDIYTASNWTGHIHLEQILGTYDMNTLLGPQSGFRGFSDTDPPVINEVKLYDPASSTEISISSPILKSEINIRSKAHGDQSWGSSNVGSFEMGYQIVDAGTGQIQTQAYPTQAYARIPTAYINSPGVAYDTTSSNNSNYYYFVNKSIAVSAPISLTSLPSGTYKACVLVKDAKDPRLISSCSIFRLDKTKPTVTLRDANGIELFSGGASSMTTITVTSTDTFGLAQIAITGVAPRSVSGYTVTETFTGLADGQYTASVTDLAGNVFESGLEIKTSGADTDNKDKNGNDLPDVFPSTYCVAGVAEDSSGIASITLSGPGFSDTTTFDCTPGKQSTDAVGHLRCGLTAGAYVTTSVNCAGVPSYYASTITAVGSPNQGFACLGTSCQGFEAYSNTPTFLRTETNQPCGGCDLQLFCDRVVQNPKDSCDSSGGGVPFFNTYTGSCPIDLGFSVFNPSTTPWITTLQIRAGSTYNAGHFSVSPPGTALSGKIFMPQFDSACQRSNAANTATVSSSYWALAATLANLIGEKLAASIRRVLAYVPESLNAAFGSDVILTSSGTITFTLPNPSSILVSTASMAIYRYDGVDWSSTAVTSQSVSKDAVTSVISATGSIITSGYYALFFQAVDSSAPITTFAIQGSSFSFDGARFVSTDAFVVLTATDPAVNGYASTVASVTYRLDPSSASSFVIYSSSIALPLGTHVLEYRSLDYAGNAEAIQTATFTVTAGTALRTTGTAQVPGVLLNGFLGSGAKLEIESQAENTFTFLVSSANRQALVSVDNIGEVGIGVTPQANLNIGAASIGLQLRSGNSTSAVTSNQIALGYNGDYSMRHLLRTEHSTAAHGNRLDFLVWNTAVATTAVAGLNTLSLQGITTASGGSFHVQPVGEPDAEVEVSNGLATGGGTMQRLQLVAPSSRRFKTDIKDLSGKDEDQALSDVVGLKHARFRYKSRRKDGRLIEDPAQTLKTGLIYEESPESIRDGDDALSTTERLVNVELALKASMRRLEALQKRYERLKAGRNP